MGNVEIHKVLTGSFNPIGMDLSGLNQVRLAGYLIADGGDQVNPDDPKSEMRIQRLYLREDGKLLLHTMAWANGSPEFIYTLAEISRDDLEAGNVPNVLPAIPMDELEQKAQEIRERLMADKVHHHRRKKKR